MIDGLMPLALIIFSTLFILFQIGLAFIFKCKKQAHEFSQISTVELQLSLNFYSEVQSKTMSRVTAQSEYQTLQKVDKWLYHLLAVVLKKNNECPGQIPKVKAILSLYKIKKKRGWRERLLYILMNLIYVVGTYNTSGLSQRSKLNLKVTK